MTILLLLGLFWQSERRQSAGFRLAGGRTEPKPIIPAESTPLTRQPKNIPEVDFKEKVEDLSASSLEKGLAGVKDSHALAYAPPANPVAAPMAPAKRDAEYFGVNGVAGDKLPALARAGGGLGGGGKGGFGEERLDQAARGADQGMVAGKAVKTPAAAHEPEQVANQALTAGLAASDSSKELPKMLEEEKLAETSSKPVGNVSPLRRKAVSLRVRLLADSPPQDGAVFARSLRMAKRETAPAEMAAGNRSFKYELPVASNEFRVMESFEWRQEGGRVTITDADGSVYSGAAGAARVREGSPASSSLAGKQSSIDRSQASMSDLAVVNSEGLMNSNTPPAQGLAFEVSGTNLSLGTPLRFVGVLAGLNPPTSLSASASPTNPGGAGTPPAAAKPSDTESALGLDGQAKTLKGDSSSRSNPVTLFGRLSLGGTNLITIRASGAATDP